jgi:hypothetical protein
MRVWTMVVLATMTMACGRQPADAPGPGQMVVLWDGREPGRLRAAAEARWCARDSTLELFAYGDERAVGLVFGAPPGSVIEGEQTVVVPGSRLTPGTVAGVFRIMYRDGVFGYQSREGQVEVVQATADHLTGRFALVLTERTAMDPLNVRGAFREVPVTPADEPCGARAPRVATTF